MYKRKTRVFKAGSDVEGVFGNDRHTAWKTFEHSFATGEYNSTLSGSSFPHRSDLSRTISAKEELSAWETAVEKAKTRNRRELNSMQSKRSPKF